MHSPASHTSSTAHAFATLRQATPRTVLFLALILVLLAGCDDDASFSGDTGIGDVGDNPPSTAALGLEAYVGERFIGYVQGASLYTASIIDVERNVTFDVYLDSGDIVSSFIYPQYATDEACEDTPIFDFVSSTPCAAVLEGRAPEFRRVTHLDAETAPNGVAGLYYTAGTAQTVDILASYNAANDSCYVYADPFRYCVLFYEPYDELPTSFGGPVRIEAR